jgi:hypothetical protein
MLKKNGDMKGAIDVYSSFPIKEKSDQSKESKNEQRFIYCVLFGFFVRILKLIAHILFSDGNLILFAVLKMELLEI